MLDRVAVHLESDAWPGLDDSSFRRRFWFGRVGRRSFGWLLLVGWVVLPLLPLIGLGLSRWAGLSLR